MPSTGIITIDGKTYTWTSPTLADLEHFEAMVGPITDLAIVNSVKGRVWLTWLCLRQRHPDLTPKIIGEWPASAYLDLWPAVKAAIPFWDIAFPEGPPTSDSSIGSSSPSTSSPAGPPPAPEQSE